MSVEDALERRARDAARLRIRSRRYGGRAGLAPHRLQAEFAIGGQEHFYLEGQISVAAPGEGREITVYASTQDPTEVQHIVGRILGIPDAFITVETRRMGGGFGGKESQACAWAAIAALGARVTGAPCKVRLDRDDDFALTGKRHAFRDDWRIGFDDEGRVSAYDVALNANCGCSADLSPGVVDRAMFHASNCYFLPVARVASRRLKTNIVSATAFRGFGGPQAPDRHRRALDCCRAGDRGLATRSTCAAPIFSGPAPTRPPTIRRSRIVRRWRRSSPISKLRATTARGEPPSPPSALEKPDPQEGHRALAPVQFGISFTLIHLNQAGALVHVYSDGSIQLNHGGTEMGQKQFTKVAQVVAEEFGVPLDFVRITATNTAKVPNASPTAASSGSDINGMAAKIAAGQMRQRMNAFAAET